MTRTEREFFTRQYRKCRRASALGKRLDDDKQYFLANIAADESLIALIPLGRALGKINDHRGQILKNIRLNANNLHDVNSNYHLKTLFSDNGDWYNVYSPREIMKMSINEYHHLYRSLIDYEAVSFQNILLNADVHFRQKYGCFGLTALNDLRIERHRVIAWKKEQRWLKNILPF